MTIDEMVTLIQAVSKNGLTSFEYEEGGQRLVLKKKPGGVYVAGNPAGPVNGPVSDSSAAAAAGAGMEVSFAPQEDRAVEFASDQVVVSPLVGTFYSASAPGAEPFVKVGDRVKKGQVLGIIEAMKLMNEIESDYDGVVEAVLVENEGVVEYGQPLFRIH